MHKQDDSTENNNREHMRNQRSSSRVKGQSQTKDVVNWDRMGRRFWNEYVSPMANNRLAKIARIGKPAVRRLPGRSPKR
ncbi:hypothetical protein QE152_g9719 [Popillia japonica]|uniref:Uncharacterized protein n=1 Tax=Popillia japonica TaxID=7064 RepID=A0AAW1LU22_POPJA